jgi:hypothetical protein
VDKIGMNKAAGKKTVPLPVVRNRGRIKDQVIQDLFIAECGNGYKYGDDDDDEGDR